MSYSFYYLSGPMAGIKSYNYPRVWEVADKLRKQGYTIVSPAELTDPELMKRAVASESGRAFVGRGYFDLLNEELEICAQDDCSGGVFLEGWHESYGAREEFRFLAKLGKELYEYSEAKDEPVLTVLEPELCLI